MNEISREVERGATSLKVGWFDKPGKDGQMSTLGPCKGGPCTAVTPPDCQGANHPTENPITCEGTGEQDRVKLPAGPPQVSVVSTPQSASKFQPPTGAYMAKDLGFGPLDFRYWDPKAIPQLQTSILLPVRIPASDD